MGYCAFFSKYVVFVAIISQLFGLVSSWVFPAGAASWSASVSSWFELVQLVKSNNCSGYLIFFVYIWVLRSWGGRKKVPIPTPKPRPRTRKPEQFFGLFVAAKKKALG